LTAAARASLEYDIKDPYNANELKIDPNYLLDNTAESLWTNIYYQLPEWRVIRNTGIKSSSVLRTFKKIGRTLFSNTASMLELQYLWMDGSLPRFWWDAMPSIQECTFNELLFTDVNQASFKLIIPLNLEEFAAHIAAHAKEIREALNEHWLISAGGKLSQV
jgi:hypothetical protein